MITLVKIRPTDLEEWNSLLEQDLTHSQFENILRKNVYFFIHNEKKETVGSIGLFNLTETTAYIDYFIEEDFRRQGHASAAVPLLLKYAQDELSLSGIKALVLPSNIPSIKIIQKSHFHSIGHEKEFLLFEKLFT